MPAKTGPKATAAEQYRAENEANNLNECASDFTEELEMNDQPLEAKPVDEVQTTSHVDETVRDSVETAADLAPVQLENAESYVEHVECPVSPNEAEVTDSCAQEEEEVKVED